MARRPPIPITAHTIARAEELAGLGLPLKHVAIGCGMSRSTLAAHLLRARRGEGTDADAALLAAIRQGQEAGAAALVQQLHQLARSGDGKSAQWLLTHCPGWREVFSDSAHIRREVDRSRGILLDTLEEAHQAGHISADGYRHLLLMLQARGFTSKRPEAADAEVIEGEETDAPA